MPTRKGLAFEGWGPAPSSEAQTQESHLCPSPSLTIHLVHPAQLRLACHSCQLRECSPKSHSPHTPAAGTAAVRLVCSPTHWASDCLACPCRPWAQQIPAPPCPLQDGCGSPCSLSSTLATSAAGWLRDSATGVSWSPREDPKSPQELIPPPHPLTCHHDFPPLLSPKPPPPSAQHCHRHQ